MAGEAANGRHSRLAPMEDSKINKRLLKDSAAPRRAQSAFSFFAEENRHIVGLKWPGETSSSDEILGHIWTGLSSADKAPYEQMAAADKARYEHEMAEFLEKAKL